METGLLLYILIGSPSTIAPPYVSVHLGSPSTIAPPYNSVNQIWRCNGRWAPSIYLIRELYLYIWPGSPSAIAPPYVGVNLGSPSTIAPPYNGVNQIWRYNGKSAPSVYLTWEPMHHCTSIWRRKSDMEVQWKMGSIYIYNKGARIPLHLHMSVKI